MPAEFKVFPERRLVYSRGTGIFTPADYTMQMAQLSAHPDFKPEFDHLVDCRSIETLAFNGEQIRDIGSRSVFAQSSRRAFVVSTEVQFGLTRMLATYRLAQDRQEIQAFRELPEALAWLNLPLDFDPLAGEKRPEASSLTPGKSPD